VQARRLGAVLDRLDAGRELDPDGDVDPAVHAAPADAINGLTFGLKSGAAWRPNGARPYAPKASR